MNELAKAIRHFIARDVIYVIGGGTVILSIAYWLDIDEKWKSYPAAIYWFGVGILYVVGYTIQELISLLGIIRTGSVRKLWRPIEFFYNRFTGSLWEDLESVDLQDANATVDWYGNERQIAKIERTITLKHISSTMGACALVSAFVVGSHFFVDYSGYDLAIASVIFAFTAVWIVMCWVKCGQEQQQTLVLSNWLKANVEAKDKQKHDQEE